MLPIIVLFAEALVVIWFAVFGSVVLSMYLDSRNMPSPKMDMVGRSLIGNAKLAFVVGMSALGVLTALEIAAL